MQMDILVFHGTSRGYEASCGCPEFDYASDIIYIACDPITLARDINYLKSDYNIKSVIGLDMFSFTYHVECVCVLSLK